MRVKFPCRSFLRDWMLPGIVLAVVAVSAEARQVRVATYNVKEGVGTPGNSDYNAVKSVLQRIDADVVAFQELVSSDTNNWKTLAAELGYTYVALSGLGPFAGGLYQGYYSRFPILSTFNVASPPGAVELTRAPFRAVIAVPDAAKPLVIWTMHHKALTEDPNPFRRAVEAIRIVQDINAYVSTNAGHDEFVLVGDLNDDVARADQPVQYNSLPSGLPSGYTLGSDITFPVLYRVFPTDRYALAGGGLHRLVVFQQASSNPATYPSFGSTLDYIFLSTALTNSGTGEVYNSAQDAACGGCGLPKAGSPLPAGTSTTASDHFAVFADVNMADAALPNFVVTPTNSLASSGEPGGPFTPGGQIYTLSNTNAAGDLSWTVTRNATWLDVSATSGLLAAGDSTNITVSINANANSLAAGNYSDTVRFHNAISGTYVSRTVNLTVRVPGRLAVSPTTGFSSSGLEGGPFSPSNQVYTLSNTGSSALNWAAGKSAAWLGLSATSGTLAAGSNTTVNVFIHNSADGLPEGRYNDTVSFTNTTNGHGNTNRVVHLTVLSSAGGFFDDVESGTNGWMATGMWHIVGTGACSNWFSPIHSWYYGRAATCTFNTNNLANSGNLDSPPFLVPAGATLTYRSWEQTESAGTTWDRRIVYISTNDAASWIQIHQSVNNASAWYEVSVSLTNFAGRTARLRFRFDTIDGVANDYRGWYIDDVRVAGPPALAVAPAEGLNAAGEEGGPFAPAQQIYTLSNTGSATLNWSASVSNNWLSLSATAGTLGAGTSTNITVSINSAANALAAGVYSDTLTFSAASTGAPVTRAINLTVHMPPRLAVSPTTGFSSSGPVGGPFSPASQAYTLSNTGSSALNWTANKSANWLSLSPTNGSLAAGASTSVVASINANANALTAGAYSDTIGFTNTTNGAGNTNRAVNLTVLAGFGFFDDFSTFAAGHLVGQRSWTQLGAISSLPLQVSGGQVVIPFGQSADNQDAYKNITATSATTFYGITLTVSNAPNATNPAYFTAMTLSNNGTGFANYRLTARAGNAANTNFVLGARITGQTSDPYSFGPGLSYGNQYRVIVATSVTGSNMYVYVNPTSSDLGSQTPYLTHNIGTGAAPPPQVGSFVISQFASGTVPNAGVSIGRVVVANNFADAYNALTPAPANLAVAPAEGLNAAGEEGGPFAPSQQIYTLSNTGSATLSWSASVSNGWASLSASAGTLAAGAATNVTVALNSSANAMVGGLYSNRVSFVNLTNGNGSTHRVATLLVRDGISDEWRLLYFGHVDPRADDLSRAADDPDGDGLSNLHEFIFGSLPLDATSRVALQIRRLADGNVELSFRAAAGRVYTLEYRDAPDGVAGWQPVRVFEGLADGQWVSYVDDGADVLPPSSEAAARLYRLRARLGP